MRNGPIVQTKEAMLDQAEYSLLLMLALDEMRVGWMGLIYEDVGAIYMGDWWVDELRLW